MYIVYDGEKKARYPDINVHPSWCSCEFTSALEAKMYAIKWLGAHFSVGQDTMKIGERFYYGGGGDYIIIKDENPEK